MTDGRLLQVEHGCGDRLAPFVDAILAWVDGLEFLSAVYCGAHGHLIPHG